MATLDVFGLGQCCVDYVGQADRYPPPDAKCELSTMTVTGGGPVANALVALARWGDRCAFAGVTGDDPFAALIREGLEAEGIDIGGLVTRPGAASQFAFILAEKETGRRNVFWRRPTGAPLSPGEVDLARLRTARVLHTDGLFADAALTAARAARTAGLTVVVDAGTLRDGMLELARESDCFLASATFARSLMGGDDPEGACRRLAELGPRVTAVTLGADGLRAREDGRSIRLPAHPVEPVDTTGCGDSFHAGFIHGWLHGWDTETCLRFGSWAAARTSLCPGGRAGIPPLRDWEARPGGG